MNSGKQFLSRATLRIRSGFKAMRIACKVKGGRPNKSALPEAARSKTVINGFEPKRAFR